VPPADAAIRRVLWRILLLNLAVSAAKLGVGFATGAISIVADGFHSLVDGLSNVVALAAQAIAARPPDADHPYGHRRFEAIATFIIGGFLLLTAWEVLKASFNRLLSGQAPDVPPVSFAVLLLTLVVNVLVVVYERGRGKALRSSVLLADADHTFTDILVTCSVLAGLGLVRLGVGWADAAVGLVIVLVIARVGWGIISASVNVLVDAAPLNADQMSAVVSELPAVEKVLMARSRGGQDDVRVDLNVQIARDTTADHANNIRTAIQDAVQDHFPQVSEVQISFAPNIEMVSDVGLRARAVADGLGLGVHEVIAIPGDGGMTLEMHVEVSHGISLAAAHEQVSQLEAKLMAQADIQQVVTHIEPTADYGAPMSQSHTAKKLLGDAMQMARRLYPQATWGEGGVRLALGGYALTMHCQLPGAVSVEEAHQIAEDVETQIRAELVQVQRVTIHTAPLP